MLPAPPPPVVVATVKLRALLVPLAVTTVTPAVVPMANDGTVTVQLVPAVLQVRPAPAVVPKLIAVAPPRFVPVIVTSVPGGPLVGLMAVIDGAPAPTETVCVVGAGIAPVP